MEYPIIAICALLASCLTLYSGFGLGTLLLPVFALFFPVEIAVAATAFVHGANSLLKVAVIGRHADRELVVRFGIPAILAAFIGAFTLGYASHFSEIFRYSIGSRTAIITPIKLMMGMLMFIFALFELLPKLRGLRFERKYLSVGGILSGFFGGFSGHQGALRSAFLTKVNVSPQAFVGTNAIIGCMVDVARITSYIFLFFLGGKAQVLSQGQWPLVLVGSVSAFAGVLLGKQFLHKLTMHTIQAITGMMLMGISILLLSGLL